MKLGISLIEVKYDKFYKSVIKNLTSKGIKNIHVDFCEKNFTGRKIIPYNKLEYLKKLKKDDLKIDCHIMGFHESKKGNLEKISKKISNFNFINSNFFFHLKAFKNNLNLISFLKNLNKLKLTPGLVIEINQKFNQKLDKIIENRFFDTFLIMGYKEGAGGKKFNTKSYENYKNLRKMLFKHKIKKYNIQFDGGLSTKNIGEFKRLKFDQVNGWSIIKDKKITEVIKKYNSLKKFLN